MIRFSNWSLERGIALRDLSPFVVAAYIEEVGGRLRAADADAADREVGGVPEEVGALVAVAHVAANESEIQIVPAATLRALGLDALEAGYDSHLTLVQSFTTCTVPGFVILLGEWDRVTTGHVWATIVASAAIFSGNCIEVAPMTPWPTFSTPGQPPSTETMVMAKPMLFTIVRAEPTRWDGA